VAVDAAGNLSIGDQQTSVVREVAVGVSVNVAASGPADHFTVTGATNEKAGASSM